MSHLTADVEALCVLFHDAYEAAAAEAGWETQERSRKPWADVPEANKETMRATISALLASGAITFRAPTPCPTCDGAGIVDTSPPGVEGSAP